VTGDAAAMVQRCFRHQHPEAYGRPAAPEAVVPPTLRYGAGNTYEGAGPAIGEERMGNGEDLWGDP
jgi:hypothetical protein